MNICFCLICLMVYGFYTLIPISMIGWAIEDKELSLPDRVLGVLSGVIAIVMSQYLAWRIGIFPEAMRVAWCVGIWP